MSFGCETHIIHGSGSGIFVFFEARAVEPHECPIPVAETRVGRRQISIRHNTRNNNSVDEDDG